MIRSTKEAYSVNVTIPVKIRVKRLPCEGQYTLEYLRVRIGKFILKIEAMVDPDPVSSRSWSNICRMVCFHSKYILGDKHDFAKPNDFLDWLDANDSKYFLVKELYIYNHSGLAISTGPFSDPWDSGQVGWIYVDLREVCKELFGTFSEETFENNRAKIVEQAKKCIRGEVEEYDMYLQGEVYGYSIDCYKSMNGTRKRYEKGFDSCFGFYGRDYFRQELYSAVCYTIKQLLSCNEEDARRICDLIADESDYMRRPRVQNRRKENASAESAAATSYEIQVCRFVLASDVFKNYRDILDLISELNWFTWGDADKTLVLVSDVYDHLDEFASYEAQRNPELGKRVREFLNEVLLDLCSIDGLCIDFEN